MEMLKQEIKRVIEMTDDYFGTENQVKDHLEKALEEVIEIEKQVR